MSAEVVAQLRQEVELCMQLRHPHVVQTIGLAVNAEGTRHGMVTELMDTNLAQYLQRGTGGTVATWDSVLLLVASDVCKGMAFLHERGVIHRDHARPPPPWERYQLLLRPRPFKEEVRR